MTSENDDKTIDWSCWLRTVTAASGALIQHIFIGVNEAQSAVMLPQLRKADSVIHVTPDEETWIASLGIMMAPISALLAGPFLDMFGRRRGLQYYYFNMSLGFGVLACAQNVYHIYVGRIICGIGTGLQATSVVYVAEICTTKLRCDLLASIAAMSSIGVALSTVIGGYLTWSLASLIFTFICFILFILEFFIPESPPWLYKMGRENACIQSLQRLGRSQSLIRRELHTLKLSTQDDAVEKFDIQTFLKPTVWKPFVIMSTFFLLQSALGVYILIFYSVDLVESLGTNYDPLAVSTILSVTRLLTTATITIYFRARLSRRFTVLFSTVGMVLTLICVGTYEFLYRDIGVHWRPSQWIPVLFMILYMATGMSGMLGLPWAMSGEVYPLKVRGTMTSLTYFIGFGIIFISVKEFYLCLNFLQIYGLLFAFAMFSFLTVLFGVFILPETFHKSLLEIEQSFLPKKAANGCALSNETNLEVTKM